MSSKKTIEISPELFSGSLSKTRKRREKKQKPKNVLKPNTLKKALLKSERVRGIDSKAIAISILEREITKTGFKNIKITKNFEMFRGSSLKPLIDERSVAAASIHLLHSTLYEKFENRFFYDDIEMDFEKFMQRLLRVKDFLERVKVEPKKLSAIKAMIKTTHSLLEYFPIEINNLESFKNAFIQNII